MLCSTLYLKPSNEGMTRHNLTTEHKSPHHVFTIQATVFVLYNITMFLYDCWKNKSNINQENTNTEESQEFFYSLPPKGKRLEDTVFAHVWVEVLFVSFGFQIS